MRKWFEPTKPLFLVITIIILAASILLFAQGEIIGGVFCVIFGVLALVVRIKAKKKANSSEDKK